MLTQYNLKMPHAVYGGESAMDNVTAIIRARGAKKVAMFTDKGIEGAGLFALPEEAVKAAGADYYVLDDLPAEPSYRAVQKLVDEFKHSGADLIVACGGSVMDAAKLASVLVTDEYGVKELLDDPGRAQKCVPIVLIPTTAGTGAEVTPNAIVAVPEKELKVGIVNEHMIADYVILDARMIKNLPRKIAAATGVDALAHCIECFTSNKANPFSDLYALEGLDLILNNIEAACDDPEAMTEKNRSLLRGPGHHRVGHHRRARSQLSSGRQVPHCPWGVQCHPAGPGDAVQQRAPRRPPAPGHCLRPLLPRGKDLRHRGREGSLDHRTAGADRPAPGYPHQPEGVRRSRRRPGGPGEGRDGSAAPAGEQYAPGDPRRRPQAVPGSDVTYKNVQIQETKENLP